MKVVKKLVVKGMTLTSHTLIYHCLIYLHQTIVQTRVLKVSAIAYMSQSDVKIFLLWTEVVKTVTYTNEGYSEVRDVERNGNPLCIICQSSPSHFKASNLECHSPHTMLTYPRSFLKAT